MKPNNRLLVVRQMDKKLLELRPLKKAIVPNEGWIKTIRTTLHMSLRQLGKKLSITPQSVRELEQREKEETITLKTLKEAARALNMQFVYGFVPLETSLEAIIERKAYDMASTIVKRTSVSMRLENQENSSERIKSAIDELVSDIKKELPGRLWD